MSLYHLRIIQVMYQRDIMFVVFKVTSAITCFMNENRRYNIILKQSWEFVEIRMAEYEWTMYTKLK